MFFLKSFLQEYMYLTWKHTEKYSAKFLKEVLKHWVKSVRTCYAVKNTWRCYAKTMRDDLKKVLRGALKYCLVFCKTN